MKTMLRYPGLAISLLVTLMVYGYNPVVAWHEVVTFDEFELGETTDPDTPIGRLIRVVRDEGLEAGGTEPFARLVIEDNGADGRMFHLATGGFGYSLGHVEALLDLEEAIADRGTLYFQAASEGASQLLVAALSKWRSTDFRTEWRSMGSSRGSAYPSDWGPPFLNSPNFGLRTVDGALQLVHEGGWHDADPTWVPLQWHEFWIQVDVPEHSFEVYMRRANDEQAAPARLAAVIEGERLAAFQFRREADEIAAIHLLLRAAFQSVEDPLVGHPLYFNLFAVDREDHRLDRPENATLPPPLPGPVEAYGMTIVEALGADSFRASGDPLLGIVEVRMDRLPWMFSVDLDTWLYLPDLESHPPQGRRPDLDLTQKLGVWSYASNSGGDTTAGSNGGWVAHYPSFLGYLYTEYAPWAYSYNLGTWCYIPALADGATQLSTAAGTWIYHLNSQKP